MAQRGSFFVLGTGAIACDVIQKIGKTLSNTQTTSQKRTNNGFRNTNKHPGTPTILPVRFLNLGILYLNLLLHYP